MNDHTPTTTHPPLTRGTAPLATRPLIRVRWDAVLTTLAAFVAGVGVGVSLATQVLGW